MRKDLRGFVKAFVLSALAAGIFLFSCGFAPERLPRPCFVDGADVSGMTVAAARASLLQKYDEELSQKSLTVRVAGRAFVFRPPELYWKTNLSAVLERARRARGSYSVEKRLCLTETDETLRGICDNFYQKSVSAAIRFDPENTEPFSYESETRGTYVHGARLKEAVEEALASGAREVCAAVEEEAPRLTLAQAKERTSLLSSFTTCFNAENSNRAHNIALAAKKISGTVLEPGQTFSFNAAAGARTAENGYLEAPTILEGEFVPGVGGGVCQASTTVYNAAILAGLKAVEYHPHSLSVGYVEPSFDAMVSGTGCDLKIKNELGYPVYFVCRTGKGSVTVRVYGMRSDITYLRESVVTERVAPPDPEIREGDADKEIRAAKEGLKSEGYLIRREPGRPDVRVRLRRDSYACVQGILQVAPRPEENPEGETEGSPQSGGSGGIAAYLPPFLRGRRRSRS